MTVIANLLLFALAIGVIWLATGHLIEVVDRLARRFRRSGFTVAFFVLGFLTSISEFSVMVNSTLAGEPEVSSGNLAGASIVLLLLLVPVLAILANGIHLRRTLRRPQLGLCLVTAALPALFLLDGEASTAEGTICVLVYVFLAIVLRKESPVPDDSNVEEILEEVIEEYSGESVSVWDGLRLALSGILLFGAGNLLVEQTVYLADLLDVPASAIGLVVLSFGTNVPEFSVAVRSIQKGHLHIAFGNYVGSSMTNALLFGVLLLMNAPFEVDASEFAVAAMVMTVGFSLFYVFAWSHSRLSRMEGSVLVLVYGVFLALQVLNQATSAGG